MTLILQIILLVIGVGGAIVSALALDNPTLRIRFVVGFGLLGLLGLFLTIITYEATPGVPHLSDAWNWALSVAVAVWTLVSAKLRERNVQVVLAFVCGAVFSPALIWVALKLRNSRLKWISSHEIFEMGDPDWVKQYHDANNNGYRLYGEVEEINVKIKAVPIKPSTAPLATPEPEELAVLRVEKARLLREIEDSQTLAQIMHRMAVDSVHDKLKTGSLKARGYPHPVRYKSRAVDIPAERWVFLRLNNDFTEATGKGLTYSGIRIARVSWF